MMIHLKHDKTAWWKKTHNERCDIEVLGAEPLQIGGGCTCGVAFLDPDPEALRDGGDE